MNIEEFEEFMDSDITPTASVNIIIGAVNAALESGIYDETNQAIIKKALATIKAKSDEGKNFMIKVK